MDPERMTRLVLIGAAGLDWTSTAAAAMPHLSALQARGTAGWLRSAGEPVGPAPWVSMVTGRSAAQHGVWRREEAWSGGLRPVSQASWRAPPVWAHLAAAGVSTASVAWPAARPGASWAGDHVDRDFATATGLDVDSWALPRRSVPAKLREALRGLRVHPTQITGDMLLPLVPTLNAIDQRRDLRLPRLAVAMAQAATVQAAAVSLLTTRRPEALFVHHAWLGEVLAEFGADQDGPFAGVADGARRFLDRLIGHLANLAGADALVMVASPGWRGRVGALIAGPAPASRPWGADASLVAATVLAHFGLQDTTLPAAIAAIVPPADRKPIPQVASSPPPGPDLALLQDALDAGYAAPPPATASWRAEGWAELAFNLLTQDPGEALAMADQALALAPDLVPAIAAKALALTALEAPDPLPALARKLDDLAPRRGWGALAHAAYHALRDEPAEAAPWLMKAEEDPDPEVLLRAAAIWYAAGRPADAERLFRDILARDPENVAATVGAAVAAAARRDFRTAEDGLIRALRIDPGRPAAYLQLAQVYARTARAAEARQAAERAISLGADPGQAEAALQSRFG
jgi:hypothetical protein